MTQTAGQSKTSNNAAHVLPENLPARIAGFTLSTPEDALKASEGQRRAGHAFPSGPAPQLYNSYLEETPFVIVSEMRFARKPASSIKEYDASGNISGVRTIPEQDCVQCTVQLLVYEPDTQRWEYAEPQLATLTGAYLLNQVHSLLGTNDRTSILYSGAVWTVRRNKKHVTTGGQHPYMLDLYDRAQDPAFKAEAASTF